MRKAKAVAAASSTTMVSHRTGRTPVHSPGKGKSAGKVGARRFPLRAAPRIRKGASTSMGPTKPTALQMAGQGRRGKESTATRSKKRLAHSDAVKLGRASVSRKRSVAAKKASRKRGVRRHSAETRRKIGIGVRKAHAARRGLLRTETTKGVRAYRKSVKGRRRKMAA